MDVHYQGTEHSHLFDFQGFLTEPASNQVWMRQCPRCKAPIEKEEPLDSWKCIRCGWE